MLDGNMWDFVQSSSRLNIYWEVYVELALLVHYKNMGIDLYMLALAVL